MSKAVVVRIAELQSMPEFIHPPIGLKTQFPGVDLIPRVSLWPSEKISRLLHP
jgi:hypothetical protein